MREKKRRFELFNFFNADGIRAHLEKMAKNGWMIEHISNFGWVYRRIEPKNIHFFVTYDSSLSEFDPYPTEEQRHALELYEKPEWKLACTSAQMKILYSEEEHPVQPERKPLWEVAAIHGSAKKSLLPVYFLLLANAVLQGGSFLNTLRSRPIPVLSSTSQLLSGFAYFSLFLLCSVEIICYFWWHRKARTAAERGVFIKPVDTALFQKIMLGIVLTGFIIWISFFFFNGSKLDRWTAVTACVYMVVLLAMVNGAKVFMKKKQFSRGVNRTVTITLCFILAFGLMWALTRGVLWGQSIGFFDEPQKETYEHNGRRISVYHDELPLELEDLMDVDYDEFSKSYSGQETWFASLYTGNQQARLNAENYKDIPSLYYTIAETRSPFLYDTFKRKLIEEPSRLNMYYIWQKLPNSEAEMWGADEVYQRHSDYDGYLPHYLLCYDHTLVDLTVDFDLTAAQKKTIGEKLN